MGRPECESLLLELFFTSLLALYSLRTRRWLCHGRHSKREQLGFGYWTRAKERHAPLSETTETAETVEGGGGSKRNDTEAESQEVAKDPEQGNDGGRVLRHALRKYWGLYNAANVINRCMDYDNHQAAAVIYECAQEWADATECRLKDLISHLRRLYIQHQLDAKRHSSTLKDKGGGGKQSQLLQSSALAGDGVVVKKTEEKKKKKRRKKPLPPIPPGGRVVSPPATATAVVGGGVLKTTDEKGGGGGTDGKEGVVGKKEDVGKKEEIGVGKKKEVVEVSGGSEGSGKEVGKLTDFGQRVVSVLIEKHVSRIPSTLEKARLLSMAMRLCTKEGWVQDGALGLLEDTLIRNMEKLGDALQLLLFVKPRKRATGDSDFTIMTRSSSFPSSPRLYLELVQYRLRQMSLHAQQEGPASGFRSARQRLWFEILRNLDKDAKKCNYVTISPASFTNPIFIEATVNIGTSSPSTASGQLNAQGRAKGKKGKQTTTTPTAAPTPSSAIDIQALLGNNYQNELMGFTCGHCYPRALFYTVLLPEFVGRLSRGPGSSFSRLPTDSSSPSDRGLSFGLPATSKVLESEYLQDVVAVSCPVCCYNTLVQEQVKVLQQQEDAALSLLAENRIPSSPTSSSSNSAIRMPIGSYYF